MELSGCGRSIEKHKLMLNTRREAAESVIPITGASRSGYLRYLAVLRCADSAAPDLDNRTYVNKIKSWSAVTCVKGHLCGLVGSFAEVC